MTTTVVRKVSFSAGHRLVNHEGKCRFVHGHNYTAYFHLTADRLDDVGRVIDFAEIRRRLGGWIDEHWDHGFICARDDHELRAAFENLDDQKLFVLDGNPTAENLARYLLDVVAPRQLADTHVRAVKVVLWETRNCCAEATI